MFFFVKWFLVNYMYIYINKFYKTEEELFIFYSFFICKVFFALNYDDSIPICFFWRSFLDNII